MSVTATRDGVSELPLASELDDVPGAMVPDIVPTERLDETTAWSRWRRGDRLMPLANELLAAEVTAVGVENVKDKAIERCVDLADRLLAAVEKRLRPVKPFGGVSLGGIEEAA